MKPKVSHMDTNHFFTSLLGLTKPWKVEKVETDFETNHVHVYVGYDSQEWVDSKTGEIFSVYNRREERQWHHLKISTEMLKNPFIERKTCLVSFKNMDF